MAGILVVAHNGLGDSLVDCVNHVLGKVPGNLRVLSVFAADDP
jgi:PTS system ascorbate-specific IIA component